MPPLKFKGFLGMAALLSFTTIVVLLHFPQKFFTLPIIQFGVAPLAGIAFLLVGLYGFLDGIRIIKKPLERYVSEDPYVEPEAVTKKQDIIADKIANAVPRLIMGTLMMIGGCAFLRLFIESLLF